MGIEGKWLENIKEMYNGTVLEAITAEGMTPKVQMKRGIRQGCPMSPMLFALYMEDSDKKDEKRRKDRKEEPCMLMYADDMVVWGDSKGRPRKKNGSGRGQPRKNRNGSECNKNRNTKK